MLEYDLILRTLLTMISTGLAYIAWRKLKFNGLFPIVIAETINVGLRLALLAGLNHELLGYKILLTSVVGLHTLSIYLIYKALKKLNGLIK